MQDDAAGIKAIHYSIDAGKIKAYKFLIPLYSTPNVEDQSGMTPLHYAVITENEEIILDLLARNADINKKDSEGMTPLDNASKKIKKLIQDNLKK